MWTYEQKTGRMLHNGKLIGVGYSGYDDGDGVPEPGEGKNDPDRQGWRNAGPVARGRWRIGKPFFHPAAGPYVLRLQPEPGTEMCGRDGFLIHGDSMRAPGTASHGCIILPRALRIQIAESGDDLLEVVRGEDVTKLA